MSWYNDPEITGGSDPEGTPSQGNPATPPTPPGPPAQPSPPAPPAPPFSAPPVPSLDGGVPPTPPPPMPPAGGMPTSGSGGGPGDGSGGPAAMLQSIPRPALLAGAGVIAAVIVIALVSMLFGGPTEVSEREWARGLCKKIEKESKKIEDLDDESDSLDPYSDSPSERETREVLEFYTSLVDLRVTTAKNIESYNDGHVVDDREGEDMREDIADDVKKLHEDLKDMRKELGDLDPKDREDAISDMFDILSDDVDVSSNADPYSEVSLEIYDDDDCVAAHGLFG